MLTWLTDTIPPAAATLVQSGMSLWLDPTDATKITYDGSNNISSYVDKSPNAVTFSAAGAIRPIYNATGINGKPSVNYSAAAGSVLKGSNAAFKAANELTIMCVIKPTNAYINEGTSTPTPYGTILSIGRFDTVGLLFGGTSSHIANEVNTIRQYTTSVEQKVLGNSFHTYGWMDDMSFVYTITTGNSGGTQAYRGTNAIEYDLAYQTTAAADFDPVTYTVTDNDITLGGYRFSSVGYTGDTNCGFGDVLIYNRRLSAIEIAQNVAYLEGKYGISSITSINTHYTRGQSNDVGLGDQALAPAAYQTNLAGAYIFSDGTFLNHHKVSTSEGASNTQFGPDITIARNFMGMATPVPTMIQKYAVSGTNIAVDWKPTVTQGPHFIESDIEYYSSIAKAPGFGFNLNIKGMLWILGETDSQNATNAGNYQTNLQNFVNHYLSIMPAGSIFVIAQTSVLLDPLGGYPYKDIVRAAQAAVAAATPNCYLINTDNLTLLPDNLHFDTPSVIAIGNAYVQVYLNRSNVTA